MIVYFLNFISSAYNIIRLIKRFNVVIQIQILDLKAITINQWSQAGGTTISELLLLCSLPTIFMIAFPGHLVGNMQRIECALVRATRRLRVALPPERTCWGLGAVIWSPTACSGWPRARADQWAYGPMSHFMAITYIARVQLKL